MRLLAILVLIAPSVAHADSAARADFDVDAAALGASAGALQAFAAVGGSFTASSRTTYEPLAGKMLGADTGTSASFVTTTARAMVRADNTDGPGLTLQQAAHARPWAFELFQLELADRLALDIAPTLADRPDRWRRRYSSAGFDIDLIGMQYIGKRWGAQFMRLENGVDHEIQHDGGASVGRVVETADWSPLSFTLRRDGEETARLDPIVMEGKAIGGAHSGAVVTVYYPRVSGIPLGELKLDLAFGEAVTAATTTSVNGQVVSTITSEQLPDLHVPAGRARLYGTIGRFDASAGIERGMYLSMDAALVVEERATGSVATTVDGARLTASGFAAHSVIWTSPTESSEHVTGGGAIALELGLPDHWRLSNQAELARTFYASLEGERTPHVDTAFRFDLALHRTIANWVPKQRF